MDDKLLTRREFIRLTALSAAGLGIAACAPLTPGAATAPATTAPANAGAATPAAGGATQAAGAGAQATGTATFWNMPFVTQEVSPKYVQQWEAAEAQVLPNLKVDKFYGPGDYVKLRETYLLQAKNGKPDVIEGLLEDTAAYVKNGLVEPLDDRFNAWADKDQFVEATLAPLRINGKLYAIPYNTNARGMVYRKDLLDQFGLKVPTTWADLVQTARTIRTC